MSYWEDRAAQAQAALAEKTTKQIERQLRKYYTRAAKQVMADFEATYDKLINTVGVGNKPTPADLYKLDRYWQLQGQIKEQLQLLNSRQIKALTKAFEENFFDVYYSIGIEGLAAYSTLDTAAVKEVINQIWCADGNNWKQNIWKNTDKLAQTLNDELITCVASGKNTSELKHMLAERFKVSYSRADTLVETELTHIRTQASRQRYLDNGIQEVKVWADYDERRCKACGDLHETIHPIGAAMPIPAHPRCRCTILPIIPKTQKFKDKKS